MIRKGDPITFLPAFQTDADAGTTFVAAEDEQPGSPSLLVAQLGTGLFMDPILTVTITTIDRSAPMPTTDLTFREQPSCVFPAWLQDLGFTDDSWVNEAAGRAVYDTPNDDVRLVVWIAEEFPDDREYPEHPRYHVVLEHGEYGVVGDSTSLYAGDDLETVRTIVSAVVAANARA